MTIKIAVTRNRDGSVRAKAELALLEETLSAETNAPTRERAATEALRLLLMELR